MSMYPAFSLRLRSRLFFRAAKKRVFQPFLPILSSNPFSRFFLPNPIVFVQMLVFPLKPLPLFLPFKIILPIPLPPFSQRQLRAKIIMHSSFTQRAGYQARYPALWVKVNKSFGGQP